MKQETLTKSAHIIGTASYKPNRPARWRYAAWSGVTSSVTYLLPPAIALLLAMISWQVYVKIADKPEYLLPAPTRIISRLWEEPEFFLSNSWTTIYEATLGFLFGSAIAMVLAILMAHSRLLER